MAEHHDPEPAYLDADGPMEAIGRPDPLPMGVVEAEREALPRGPYVVGRHWMDCADGRRCIYAAGGMGRAVFIVQPRPDAEAVAESLVAMLNESEARRGE